MSLITIADLAPHKRQFTKTAASVLESGGKVSLKQKFDIFLSHSYKDALTLNADDLLAIQRVLEEFGFTVYVDWIVDTHLNREKVSSKTAAVLRTRMNNCKSLLFATTENSSVSKWMPWELGYKDGHNGRVAILPIVDQSQNGFEGQEYLGIYPFVRKLDSRQGNNRLWIFKPNGEYVVLDDWVNEGLMPYKH